MNASSSEHPMREHMELEEVLNELKGKIDTGSDRLKESIGTAVHQLNTYIDSADRVIGRVMERVGEAARQTDKAFGQAERFTENFEHPIEYVKKNPVQAFAGALVAGMVIGLLAKRAESRKEERRLRIAPER